MTTICLVSDSHLSAGEPISGQQWAAVVEHVERTRPDLVVHIGDLALDGSNNRADLEYARECLDRLPVPWRAVPGNHDLGDPVIPGDGASPWLTDDTRRERYEAVFGDRYWSADLDGWRLVGIDCQELGSEPDPDGSIAARWVWLEKQLTADRPTMVFQHRPLQPTAGAEDTSKRYITEPARRRLRELYASGRVEVVASGHVHQWQTAEFDEIAHVWVPSTWATIPDDRQPRIGHKRVGVVDVDLDPLSLTCTRPDGMTQAVIDKTFPSPYHT